MDIRILKAPVSYCTVCNSVGELKSAWEEGQALLVENGEQDEPKKFPGVPGYIIKDNDDYKFAHSEICEKCLHTIMKGVRIITDQNLTGISMSNE